MPYGTKISSTQSASSDSTVWCGFPTVKKTACVCSSDTQGPNGLHFWKAGNFFDWPVMSFVSQSECWSKERHQSLHATFLCSQFVRQEAVENALGHTETHTHTHTHTPSWLIKRPILIQFQRKCVYGAPPVFAFWRFCFANAQ